VKLTEKQAAILHFIKEYQRFQETPPSTRKIKVHFGLRSQSTVQQHLQALAAKGQLKQLDDGRWGAMISSVEVPILGSIPAGLPALREEVGEGTVTIDPAAFGIKLARAGHYFALRVSGDSMIEAHILPDDLVLCEWREPKPGEVIAALVDETQVTLKRLVREGGRVFLRAANPRYPDIFPERMEPQGVVLALLRRKLA
jgi:repressor LexA